MYVIYTILVFYLNIHIYDNITHRYERDGLASHVAHFALFRILRNFTTYTVAHFAFCTYIRQLHVCAFCCA